MYLLIALELLWVGLVAGVVLESTVAGVLAFVIAVLLLRLSRWLRVLFGLGMSAYWASVGYQMGLVFHGVSLGVVGSASVLAVAIYLHRPLLVPLFDALRRWDEAPDGRGSGESREWQSDAGAGSEDRFRPGPEDPHTVLGIGTDATEVEVRQAYRQRMLESHPDRVATLGDEIRDLAEAKAKQISNAYEVLTGRI